MITRRDAVSPFVGAARHASRLLLLLGITSVSYSCMKKVEVDMAVIGTRDGSEAVGTLHDFEVARSIALTGMTTFEGMHKLAPENEDVLFALTRGWAATSFAFTEDDYEEAMEGRDDQLTEYHRQRTIAGFKRARFFGVELLNRMASGFDEARRNAVAMDRWLERNFRDPREAKDLLWIGYAWIGLVGAAKDTPAIVGDLYVGVAIAERSIELDEKAEYGLGHILLGAYHARTAQSELDEAKAHFDSALKINSGKFLLTQLNYASRYFCAKSDRQRYEKLLNDVLAAGDPLPEARLSNLIAKRRARRYLGNKVFQEECGFVE